MAARREESFDVRVSAARLAKSKSHPMHKTSRDEVRYRYPSSHPHAGRPSFLASFTKGLPHDPATGLLVSPSAFSRFVRAVNKPSEEHIRRIPLGPPDGNFYSAIAKNPPSKVRAWESMGAGSTFDLQGPDAQAVTMPPPPELRSVELAHEMTEIYWMALLRDVPLSQFSHAGREQSQHRTRKHKGRSHYHHYAKTHELVDEAVAGLCNTVWARETLCDLTDAEKARRRGAVNIQTIFRGITPGDDVGPYISQFLLTGTSGLQNGNHPSDGYVQYGAMRMDQRVRVAQQGKNYMTTWAAFLDVQNAADVRGREVYSDQSPKFRFITSGRDLATYVHYDALYQAYLNACIILLDIKVPFDSGIPFQHEDQLDKQQGFATFGGPHILTLVTEVATRALKAVRFQKYNLHRRLRPEALGGLIDRFHGDKKNPLYVGVSQLYHMIGKTLLKKIGDENEIQNSTFCDSGVSRSRDLDFENRKVSTLLLPMAFPEGSPMHPSYGAGHATVGGACVTVLKAFFDHGFELPFTYVASDDGNTLKEAPHLHHTLTVEGELNKLCSNISIGRNWAGVHYFSDYYESILLGEKIALGILEEQKLTYSEDFSMTVPLFNGSTYRI